MEGFDAKTNRKIGLKGSETQVFVETPSVDITPNAKYRAGSKSKLGEKNGPRTGNLG